jgi:excisionase family DNA binding protein
MDQLITVQQLATWCQVPVTTIYRWRHVGTGPPGIRVGRFVRFDPADVRRWIASQKTADLTSNAGPNGAA